MTLRWPLQRDFERGTFVNVRRRSNLCSEVGEQVLPVWSPHHWYIGGLKHVVETAHRRHILKLSIIMQAPYLARTCKNRRIKIHNKKQLAIISITNYLDPVEIIC